MRFFVWMGKPKRWLAWLYRAFPRRGMKIQAPVAAMRQLWTDRGTTGAVSLSVENGDAPVMNWKGVGSRDFPLGKQGYKLDGKEVDKYVTKKLSCGDCPMPCKGIVRVKDKGLEDVRRPDYETICGFGANLLNDDLELVTACHDACNRYGMDAVSSSATLGWVCEAVERGLLTKDDLDGVDLRWGNGAAALALTIKMGEGSGCGAWLAHGVERAARHLGKGSEQFAVHVHGSEPAYHDPRFTSLMGVTYTADPTPGRHTAGSASWNETFGVGFSLPAAAPKGEVEVKWKGDAGKGQAQAHFSNAHQAMNGLGLCMFTMLTGRLPWLELVNTVTGWGIDEAELLRAGERIQNLRAAFNWREGCARRLHRPPADDGRGRRQPDRQAAQGRAGRAAGPARHLNMHWDTTSGRVSKARAQELGIAELLGEFVA
jgi:aldehyde:ferredoxin oxidoreductase